MSTTVVILKAVMTSLTCLFTFFLWMLSVTLIVTPLFNTELQMTNGLNWSDTLVGLCIILPSAVFSSIVSFLMVSSLIKGE